MNEEFTNRKNSRIAFSAGDSFYTVDPNGEEFLSFPWKGFDLAWSPCGQRIAFTSPDEETGLDSLWLVEADGQSLTRISMHCDSNISNIAWHPNGRVIAYDCYLWEAGDVHQVRIVDVESGRILYRSAFGYNEPFYGPQEKLFVSEIHVGDIFEDLDGGFSRNDLLSDIAAQSNGFRFSQDRSKIVGTTRGCKEMFIMNADGHNYSEITIQGREHYSHADLGPDNDTIAVRVQSNRVHELWRLSQDGSQEQCLASGFEDTDGNVNGFGRIGAISWSP